MSTLTLAIVIVFCIGYLFIAIESVTKINKAAIALLMLVATWTLFMISPDSYLPMATGEQSQTVQASVLTAMQRKVIFFLGVGGLIFASIVISKWGYRFGVPTLLLSNLSIFVCVAYLLQHLRRPFFGSEQLVAAVACG
jgi:hypothetical protein